MKFKNEPLWSFLQWQRASGVEVGVFPSNKRDDAGNARFTLRVIDPDDPETGYTFIASFSKKQLLAEASCEMNGDKPTRDAVAKSKYWDSVIKDAGKAAKYVACHCTFEPTDDAERAGETFISITKSGTASSISSYDAFEDEGETATAATPASEPAPAKPNQSRNRNRGARVSS